MGPLQSISCCIFKKEFLDICGLYYFMRPNISRKTLPKIWYIYGNFFKKSMFYASKWSQMDKFWWLLIKITYTTTQALYRKFWKLWKILKIRPQKSPKFTCNCTFTQEILADCVVLWVKTDFVLFGPPRDPPKYL